MNSSVQKSLSHTHTASTDLGEEPDDREHGRAAVLKLRLAVRVEALLGALGEAHRVEEPERSAGADHV